MALKITSKGPPLNTADLAALESRVGVRFPEDYRNFLLAYGVAIPDPNVYKTGKITTSVSKFFGVSKDDRDDLLAENRIYSGRLPANMIPIALAGGGNLILLSATNGSVFFWDHEQEAMPYEAPSFDNMQFLASSFHQFLDQLQPAVSEAQLDPRNVLSVKLKAGFAEKFKKNM